MLEDSPELDTPQTLQTAVLGPSAASTTGDPVGPACSLGLPGNRQRAGLTSSSWLYFHLTHLWTCSGCSCPQSGRQRECLEWATLEGALMSLGCSSNQGTGPASICYCTEPSFCPQAETQAGARNSISLRCLDGRPGNIANKPHIATTVKSSLSPFSLYCGRQRRQHQITRRM